MSKRIYPPQSPTSVFGFQGSPNVTPKQKTIESPSSPTSVFGFQGSPNVTPKQKTIKSSSSPTSVFGFPGSPTVTPKQNINKTILKQQFLSTYLTFTYEMGPAMEKKLFWRYVLLLLYSYNQMYGGNMNMFIEQYYTNTNTMSGVVSEDQQKKWANDFMKLLNKMDGQEGRQIFMRLQKNISNNIK